MVRKFIISALLLLASVTAHAHSLQLGGNNGMVTFPYDTLYDNLPVVIHNQFRIDVLPTVKGEHETILVLERNSGADYIFNLYVSNVDNKVHFKTNSGTGVDIESDSALEVGKKYSVLVTIDSSRNVKMYIDQQVRGPDVVAADLLQTDQATTAVLDTSSPGDLITGCRSGGTDCLDGTMFETILWNANPATFAVISLFNGIKVEADLINHWPYFDGAGSIIWSRYQYPSTGYENGVASGDYSWNIDSYNFMIEDEYAHHYFPGNLTGTMDINSGLSKESEKYSPTDYSWNDMHKVTHCTGTKEDNLPLWYYDPDNCEMKCDREWHASPSGNDITGDGSEGNPWKTLGKLFESYALRPKYRDCFFLHAGDYYDRPGLYYSAENLDDPVGNEKNRIWIGAYGDGRVRIFGDDSDNLVWTTHSGNIKKANYQADNNFPFFQVSNIILDDNFPDCCEKMESLSDLGKDGDWFADEKTGTNTSVTTNKLVDSTANFGAETPPVEVGMMLRNNSTAATATITAIDSTTQLSLDADIFLETGKEYRIYGDTYVYLGHGSDPYDDRQAIVTGKGENIAFGFTATMPHITIFGVELIGSQSYSINSFSTFSAPDFDVVRVTAKYSKGLSNSGKGWRQIQNRTHGNINSGVGNGLYFGVEGGFFGWPSDVGAGDDGILYGNIVTWTGGECLGGQFSDNKRVSWNIAVNCWSVAYYVADSSKNLTLNNNVAMIHKFMPHYVSKKSNNSIQRCWRRMISEGVLNGDEEAPYTQHFDMFNNVLLGTKTGFGQFSSCGVSSCHGNPYPDEPYASGWKYINVSNNIYVAPPYNSRATGEEWQGWYVIHQSGPTNDDSIGSMFVNNFSYYPNSGYKYWWNSGTLIPEPNIHLSDNNYYLSKYPHAFSWRDVKYDFDDFKTVSSYDANSQFVQPNADGTVNGNLMTRTDWDMEGEVTFKFSDFYPTSGSVLINAGHTFDLTGTWSYHDFQWDVRGNRRAIGSATDIGIFSTEPWIRTDIGNGTISGGSF